MRVPSLVASTLLLCWIAGCGGGRPHTSTETAKTCVDKPPPPGAKMYKRCDGTIVIQETRVVGDDAGVEPHDDEGPDVQAVFREVREYHQREIQGCFEEGLTRDPDMHGGRIVIAFTLLEDGSVADVGVQGFDAGVDACLSGRVKTWHFDNPDRHRGPITLTFALAAH